MQIELSEFLSVEDKEMNIRVELEMDSFCSKLGEYPLKEKKPFEVHLKNTGKKKFLLETSFSIILNIPCDRCLEPVDYPMKIRIRKEIDMNESETDGIEFAEEHFYISENRLDVEKLIYNEILINLPMKVLCSENCKGICNRCGANLNSQSCDCDRTELDPRMSKIRDIFNNFKEV